MESLDKYINYVTSLYTGLLGMTGFSNVKITDFRVYAEHGHYLSL